ncbi:MAG: glycosyltransferase [Lachnospiraceae bacterium]|nr:glycosyltransferase [Lachnospiraceae bacterium]
MKFLVVQALWKQYTAMDIAEAVSKLGYEAEEYPVMLKMASYLSDEEVDGLVSYVQEHHIQVIISLYFVMNAALAAYKSGIRYVSVLWDAPYVENYNLLSKIDNVWFTTFDRLDRDRFLEYGMPHVLYQPLSVNKENAVRWNAEIQKTLKQHYIHDISFIGNLYSRNLYKDNLQYIPVELQYYFNSIFEEAMFRWDGVNRVYGKTGSEIVEYIKKISPEFSIPNRQDIEDVRYFESMGLIREIANIERIAVLNLLAEEHSVMLYTADHEEAKAKLQGVEIGPPVEYGKATSLVYAGSKINLNISLKGIEGGTPQRIMDIMGAGGFVLSAYCEETAELFEEDREIVMFRTPEELVEKVDYYLAHDKEREQIARRGCEKVLQCYTYENKMRELIDWITGEA